MKAQEEKLTELKNELEEMFRIHWHDLALNKKKVALNIDWDQYEHLEQSGGLVTVTVRDPENEHDIVAYYVGYIHPGLHYKSCITCVTDVFYVHPLWRGEGVGTVLFKGVEDVLRARGVQRWICATKLHKPNGDFMDHMGFKAIETVHAKML